MDIREYREYKAEDVLRLYASVGWTAYTDDPAALERGFRHSLLVLAAWEDGELGQIVIRTDKGKPLGLFKEYYLNDELTREVWHDGVYYTGDVAWRDEDGYFWFVGRADDVIKSSGYRIGPFEVESALMTHPAVVECAITGVPDEIRGQVVKATIILGEKYRAQAGEALIKELQNHVKRITAPYKYPRIIEFVEELPKTISGKIRRKEIRNGDEKR